MTQPFSNSVLAFTGDAVYSLLVRENLANSGNRPSKKLHTLASKKVCAAAQSKAYRHIWEYLTEDEAAVMRRGRNSHCGLPPKNTGRTEYQEATGLECLFGWLWLTRQAERAREIFQIIDENVQIQ
ncbi:MAG: ribonuclease III [Oscillospiraceae bacterium]|nr:ribonuclease III [Oscillospiraceae bacterium]